MAVCAAQGGCLGMLCQGGKIVMDKSKQKLSLATTHIQVRWSKSRPALASTSMGPKKDGGSKSGEQPEPTAR